MLRQILPITDPRLFTKSAPVDVSAGITPEIIKLGSDLLDTSRAVRGAGMAAIQVGVPVRVFLMDLAHIDGDTILFINPEIISLSEEKATRLEGCLSMPNIATEIERPATAMIRYVNLDGNIVEYHAEGFAAQCVQHEMDHLDGVRMIDHVTPMKRAMLLTKFQKQRRRGGR